MIVGKFAPLTIIDNEDTDLDSMTTTLNTAVIETASEILGKHHLKKKKKPGSQHKLCDKMIELRKKRLEPEIFEKVKEVNSNIKRYMRKLDSRTV